MKRLERSSCDYMIGGVCGGLGRYMDIDPTFIRLIWALFFLVYGFGFLLYMLCWFLLPISYKY